MAGPRRRSREIALQILHQVDAGGEPFVEADVAISRYFEHLSEPDEDSGAIASIDRPLIEELVRGVCAHRAEIDDLLTNLSRNWRLERMAVVERNVIRVALFELKYSTSVPVNVVLNEAVELAKRYGTSEGAAFVNGLLDRAVDELNRR
jgi:transcription antitermination protein NusB